MPSKSQFRLLGQRRFLPFYLTQFSGAFNDNLFKNALLLLITFSAGGLMGLSVNVVVNRLGVSRALVSIFDAKSISRPCQHQLWSA